MLRDEAALMLAHINIPQRFQRWLPGCFGGEVQFVRHRCTTIMTTPGNEVSETSSKIKSIWCLLCSEEKLAALAVFFKKLTCGLSDWKSRDSPVFVDPEMSASTCCQHCLWFSCTIPSCQHVQRNDRYISVQPTWLAISLHGPDYFKSQLPG